MSQRLVQGRASGHPAPLLRYVFLRKPEEERGMGAGGPEERCGRAGDPAVRIWDHFQLWTNPNEWVLGLLVHVAICHAKRRSVD